jgi:pimeloyl-ACP methyl ester carboxylesterase
MRRISHQAVFFFVLAAIVLLSAPGSAYAQVTTHTGTLPDGATFLIETPANWNGTLLLYSHGYVVPGSPNPAHDVGDPATRLFLLGNGFALAGSSYATTGWALHEALPDQIAVLDAFRTLVGKPRRTIAWGHSLGGIITAGLIQRFPERFDAALPMCGVLSGGVATWNQALDSAFAFKTLLAFGSGLQLVNITAPGTNLGLAEQILATAQTTPQGRARIALAAALGDTPGWFIPTSPEPTDPNVEEANQFLWLQQVDFPFVFAFRAELEARAGGNPSWNTGVNYREQFEHSAERAEVRALYNAAGLSLDADLDTLNDAARIAAKKSAVDYLEQNIIFNGDIHIPVLSIHTSGDGLVAVQNESAYRDVVSEDGHRRFLRQAFVHRAGHCTFTPAETITALGNLITRLDTGRWPDLGPDDLNAEATALGPGFNIFAVGSTIVPTPAAFFGLRPTQFLRPFDVFDDRCEDTGRCGDEF